MVFNNPIGAIDIFGLDADWIDVTLGVIGITATIVGIVATAPAVVAGAAAVGITASVVGITRAITIDSIDGEDILALQCDLNDKSQKKTEASPSTSKSPKTNPKLYDPGPLFPSGYLKGWG